MAYKSRLNNIVYKCVQMCTSVYKCVQVWTRDLAWKSTPKWPFEHENPSTVSKFRVIFISKSADLYSKQLIWPHNWIGLEKVPQNDPLNIKIHPLDQKLQWDFCLKVSWFDLPIGLGLKKYPQMTPQMLKSINWIKISDGF